MEIECKIKLTTVMIGGQIYEVNVKKNFNDNGNYIAI